MKKAENLSEFHQLVYDFLKDAIENKKYEVCLNEDYSGLSNGYIGGYVIIGGVHFRCSFNEKDFICWHVGDELRSLFSLLTDNEEKKICKAAFSIAKQDQSKNKKLIEEYQTRLATLQSAMNYNLEEE